MANSFLPPSGQLNASSINRIRGCKTNQSVTATSANQSLRGQETFFCSQAAIPNNTAGTTTCFSEFYNASVITANVTTNPESKSTYNNCNNGSIAATLQCTSIVTSSNGDKVYNFRLGSGAWVEKSENTSSPNAGSRSQSYTGLNSGAHTVSFQDGLNGGAKQPVRSGSVTVNYGTGSKSYVIN